MPFSLAIRTDTTLILVRPQSQTGPNNQHAYPKGFDGNGPAYLSTYLPRTLEGACSRQKSHGPGDRYQIKHRQILATYAFHCGQ